MVSFTEAFLLSAEERGGAKILNTLYRVFSGPSVVRVIKIFYALRVG